MQIAPHETRESELLVQISPARTDNAEFLGFRAPRGRKLACTRGPALLAYSIMKTGIVFTLAVAAVSIYIDSARADKLAQATGSEAGGPPAGEESNPKASAKADRNVFEVGVKVAECECCGKANGKGVREALFKLKGVKRVSFQSRSGVAIIRMKDKDARITKEEVAAIFVAQKLEHALVKYVKAIDEPARRSRPSAEAADKEAGDEVEVDKVDKE
jgi:hypothetical protein